MQSWEDKKEQLAPQLTAPWRNSDGEFASCLLCAPVSL